MTVRIRNRSSAGLNVMILLVLASCTPPIRQYDLNDQPVTCEEASRFSYDSLKGMGYTVTTFTPAASGRPGVVKGTLDEAKRSSSVTVTITCAPAGPTIDASEDGKLLGQIDFKRGFYMTFTGVISQRRAIEKSAKEQAALPLAQRKQQGFEVLLTPVHGLDAQMELPTDLTAVGILPVRVVINNRTTARYQLDPDDIVMVRADGERVPPLTVDAVMERVHNTAPPKDGEAAADLSALPRQLQAVRFTATELRPEASAKGYLFYPLDSYKRARVRATEAQSEETEGFVVEF